MSNCAAKSCGGRIVVSSRSHRMQCVRCWLSCVIPEGGTEARLTAGVVNSTTHFAFPNRQHRIGVSSPSRKVRSGVGSRDLPPDRRIDHPVLLSFSKRSPAEIWTEH